MKKFYAGLDVGGTMIKMIVLDENHNTKVQKQVPTEDSIQNTGKWQENIANLVNELSDHFGADNNLLFGIAFPGLTDINNLKILNMPHRLKGLENFNWTEFLGRKIFVINDAHAATIAEYDSFYKNKINHMLMLTLGTGVGGGVIIDGKLFQGHINRAGHFGHMSVDHQGVQTMTNMVGSLEYAIGDFSVAERTLHKYKNTAELVHAYNQKEALATHWWLQSLQKLACGITSLINAFSPELIVIGGGITNAGKSFFDPLKEFISLYEWQPGGKNVEIRSSQNGTYAGAVGAALFAESKNQMK